MIQTGSGSGEAVKPLMHKLDSRSKSSENMAEHRRREEEAKVENNPSKDNRSMAGSSTNKNMQDDKIFTTSKNGMNNL